MRFSQLNDYLQTLATMGAIAGLLLVGYEVRQSNQIAESATASANWTNWVSTTTTLIDSDIARIRAKAMMRPQELTLEDKISLDLFLQSWVYLYSHDLATIAFLDWQVDVQFDEILTEVATEAPRIFGSRFSRAWLQKNKHWMLPQFVGVVETALADAPLGSELAYYESIDALAATLE